MGFDNECILNIQSLAGEYFCPVCRLLVYPNEALQSQCTHLYCKPCLTYIVGTTRACPYDGYLVTEADSKPLIESNKALAETIGKIAVHCLYHRSGCQWQGPLSECTAHCSGCAFGNSPVVCNRCGIQIVHRQVQEHAQNCPGVQPQAPQVAGGQDAAAGATATAPLANAEQTQNANQSGASTSQVQTSLTLAGPPTGQDPNQQANANSQVQAVASSAVPTPEQWYQQQYQQQYHQHPGYDPYQQPYQNYYPYQQQAIQQYQQHPPHVQGQHQPQVYSQGQPHAQFQPQVQSQAQPAPPPPPPPPPQTHQPQSQPPPQLHAQPQPLQLVHAPVAAQASVNPQHQLQPTLQPHAQMHSQAQSQPHGHPHPQPYAQAQSHPQTHPVQPHLQQHMQIPQYQQPQSQMQHPQPQIPQPHSQVHPQHSFPQLQPPRHLQAQPQAQVQPQPQPQVQPQPQPQLQPQPHPRPQLPPPPQLNQPPNINAQSQTQHPPANAVTGLQSYPQPHAHQQMQLGAQQPPHMHPQGGPILQQPHQMGPPQSHAPVPKQQQPVLLSSQGQVPSIPPAQQQPVHPHAQQPGHPGLQRPVLQPMQQPVSQQYLQHQQPFPGQTLGSVQNQLHPHGHFIQQQQPMQSQLRPQGPPHLEQQNSQDNISSQQNIALSHGLQTHQSQNYAARPMMPSHGAQSQPFFQSPVGFAGASQVRPMQLGTNQLPANLNYPLRSNHQMQMSSEQKIVQSGLTLKPRVLERQGDHMPEQIVADSKDGSSSQETALKESNSLVSTSVLGADSVQVNNLKSETDVKSKDVLQKPMSGDEDNNSQVDLHVKDTDSELHAGGNASAEPAVKQMVKKEGNESGLDSSPGAQSVKTVAAGPEEATDLLQRAEHSAEDGNSLQQVESIKKHSEKLEKDVIDAAMLVTGGADKGSQAVPLASAHTPDSFAESQTHLTGRESLLNGSQERNLSQSQPMTRGPGVDEFRNFPSHDQVLGKSFMPPGHPFPPTDQGRHQHMPMHYGPSSHQQRPAGAAMLQSALPHAQVPGQPPNMLRPQGAGHLPQPGPPLNPPDHLQPPVLKQPHGSFLPEIASGGILGPSSSSLGKGPSHFGPERNFGPQSVASQGHYNQGHVPPSHAGLPRMSQGEPPGSFNSYGGLMGRAPPHGSEGQIGQQRPINPMESEIFLDQRSRHLDGRQSDSHLLGYSERAPFGHPHGIEANVMRMNGPPGTDSSSGLRDERFNRLTEGVNRFPMEPTWHVDRGELKEDLKQFPRNPHLDTEPGPKFGSYFSSSRPNDRGPHGFSVDAVSRPLDKAPHGFNYDAGLNLDLGVGNAPRVLPPYHPGGSNDTGYRAQPVGPDGNIGRTDSTRTHPDFLGPFPGFGRRHMDWPTPRSPGREYHGFSTRDFRGLSGLDDISRESRPFGEGSRSFNLRGGELDGPGNVQSSDLIGQDILPNHLRRGEFLGPRNLRGDLLFGEPDGFGAFSGHAHMGDPAGPENFLHRLPRGEPFGGNKSGHPRLGEPGFRSSYSLTGGMDPFDNSRKRKLASMGWCRICKVDCETVEGLDLHAQTRQHQKMAMDMVLSIKKQNAKKQKTSNVHSSVEEPSKSRGNNYEVRGNKP